MPGPTPAAPPTSSVEPGHHQPGDHVRGTVPCHSGVRPAARLLDEVPGRGAATRRTDGADAPDPGSPRRAPTTWVSTNAVRRSGSRARTRALRSPPPDAPGTAGGRCGRAVPAADRGAPSRWSGAGRSENPSGQCLRAREADLPGQVVGVRPVVQVAHTRRTSAWVARRYRPERGRRQQRLQGELGGAAVIPSATAGPGRRRETFSTGTNDLLHGLLTLPRPLPGRPRRRRTRCAHTRAPRRLPGPPGVAGRRRGTGPSGRPARGRRCWIALRRSRRLTAEVVARSRSHEEASCRGGGLLAAPPSAPCSLLPPCARAVQRVWRRTWPGRWARRRRPAVASRRCRQPGVRASAWCRWSRPVRLPARHQRQ